MSDIKEDRASPPSPAEKKEFALYSVEAFSRGKTPQSNDDAWVATPRMLAVIDGVTSRIPYSCNGQSSGAYASHIVSDALHNIDPGLHGKPLVDHMSRTFTVRLNGLEKNVDALQVPYARPSAFFVAAGIADDMIHITQVGDVAFRINGKDVYHNRKEIDDIMAHTRISAINNAKQAYPDTPMTKLMKTGRAAIKEYLHDQIAVYQNNPDHALGYGCMDGRLIPEKFIKTYAFPLREISTLEIFSDGYFKTAQEPTIASWEKAFREVETEDPYKIHAYPSTKGSTPQCHSDDRTVLIARFTHAPGQPKHSSSL